MKITIAQAVGMFAVVKSVNLKEAKSVTDKVTLLWLKLYPYNKEWQDMQQDIQKEIEEIRKPFVEEIQKMSEEERKSKEHEINMKFQEKIQELPSVKGQEQFLNKEVEVELPEITDNDFKAIAQASSLNSMREMEPLYDLIAK